MSDNSDATETVATEPDEPWEDKQTLQEHIERGESYSEIAAQYDGVNRDMIGQRVRKFGLKAAGKIDGPRWAGEHAYTPLVTYKPLNVAFPIGVEYLKEMDPDYSEPAEESPDEILEELDKDLTEINPREHSVEELTDIIAALSEPEPLEELLERETEAQPEHEAAPHRTTVVEAIEQRLDDLKRRGPDPVLASTPDAPDYFRFTPRVDGGVLFDIEWGPDVDGEAGNERAVLRPNTLHVYAQFPRGIATSFNLHELGDPINTLKRQANDKGSNGDSGGGIFGQASEQVDDEGPEFEGSAIEVKDFDPENNRIQVGFKNCSPDYVGVDTTSSIPAGDDQSDLEPVTKPLYELRHDHRVQSYRLDPGKDYVEAYGLKSGKEYAAAITPFQHDNQSHVGVVLYFEKNLDAFHESLHRIVSSYEAGNYNAAAPEGEKRVAAVDQPVLYPGRSLLNGVGLPSIQTEVTERDEDDEIDDTVKRISRVKVIPFGDAIALIPTKGTEA